MAFDLGGFLKKRWDTSVIRDAVSSNTAADQQRRQVAAQKAAPVQQPKVPYYGSFSPQVTNTEQAVQQTGRDLGRQQREGQITGQQFNDRFAQLLASTTKDSGYKTPMAQAGNFAKSIVKPFWETGDTVVKGAQLGVANATNNTQAADNARKQRDQSYAESLVRPVSRAAAGINSTFNPAQKSAERQLENKLVELRNNTESFTQNKAKEIQDGIRSGIYDPQKGSEAIQELLSLNEGVNGKLGQFYDEKLAKVGLTKDMSAAQSYAQIAGDQLNAAGLLISPASGTAIRQAGGNVVRRGIAELGTNSALNGLGGAASAYGQGANLEDSLKAGATQAGVGAVMMGAGYLKGPAAIETNIPAAPGSLRESIQAAKQNVRLAINNPDGANVFKINNPLDAKTTGLDINNPMGAQTKPLDVRNPLGAETGKKLSIVDRYKQATDIDAPKQDGFVRNPLANDAPQVGKTAKFDDVAHAKANEQKLIQDYKKNYPGKMLNTDDVRESFKDVGYNRKNAADYHEGASHISNLLFDEQISTLKPGDKYLFMAGSSGAGKSHTLATHPQIEAGITAGLDGNFSSASAMKKLDRVIATGAKPTLSFVERDPLAAWQDGVMKRAIDPKNGRVVPLDIFIDNYFGSRSTVLEAAKKYGDKIELSAFKDNVPIDDPIAYLSQKGYNKSDVIRQSLQSIEDAKAAGKIDEATASALVGKYSSQRANLRRSNQEPQLQSPNLVSKPTLQDALEGKSTKAFTPLSQPVDSVPAIAKQVTSSDSANQLRSAADKNLVRLSKQEQLPQQISRTEVQAKSPRSLQNDSSANSTTKVKLNTDRLNPDGGYDAMARLDKATQETITKMSNQDIQRVAKDAGIDTKTYTDQQVRTKIAEQLNVRQDAVRLQNEADAAFKAGDFKTAEEKLSRSAAMGRVSREQGTDLARQLQARRIIANELDTPQQRVFKLLDNAGVNPEVYTKRLSKVDFSNPQEVVKAYRELVPAKAVDWLDTVRYNSMLSSPLTHIVNTASNALNVGVVAPLEKTLRGVADATGGLFGKERKYAAGEGAAYAKGSASNIKKAAGEFMDVMRGIDRTQNLDLQEYSTPLAIGGVKGATYQTLSFPMKMLGASDKFFRTLAEGGETAALNLRESKGIKLGGNKRALAEAEGAYRLYQQDTNLKGQGGVLQSIDSVTNSIMKLRKDHIWARFVFPFVKTPTNILKQGVEFSPLGFANAVTAADKTTALTRAAIGTAVFGASAAALGAGDLTWGTPTNKDARDRFLAEGKQPYAIRIGGKWVSFAKLPPAVSFPLALTAGIDDAIKQKKMSESTADAVLEGVAKWGQFLGDQSYVKNIGDTLAAFKGDADRATQAVANYPQQVVPFRALTSWFARMTDDTERKVDADASYIEKQVQSLLLNYPGLRQKVGTRDYRGQPIPANNPVLNSFAPFKITDQRATHPIDAELDANKAAPKATLLTPKQTSDIDKLAKAKINEYQNQLIQSDEYKALSSDDKRKRLASLAEDVKVVESRKYQTKYAVGERALDFTGKETVLSKNQAALILNGDISPYKQATSTSTPKTKEQSDYEVASSNRDLTMTRAKANNDLAAWNTAAAEEYDAIGKQIKALDPKTDQVKINTLIKKQEALQRTALGYKANGYIKKTTKATGKGSKGGKFTIPTSSVASSARTSTFTNLNRLLAGTTKTNSNKGKIGNKVALRKITVKGVKS